MFVRTTMLRALACAVLLPALLSGCVTGHNSAPAFTYTTPDPAKGVVVGTVFERAVDEGGYELIQIDGNGSDEMDALVVYRRDTDDIIQAAALMGVTIRQPLAYYRGIEAMVGKRPF